MDLELVSTRKEVVNQIDEAIKEFYSKLNTTKEDIIKGFVTQYGYMPNEIVLIEQETPNGRKFWVEKRNNNHATC